MFYLVLGSPCLSSKKIHKSFVTNPNVESYPLDQLKEILRGIELEITLLSKMRHENIITLLGVAYRHRDRVGDVLPMLVMESVQCDLHYYLQSTKSTYWNEDLVILQGISSGLVYLHEVESIIHNDISTKSILLTKNLVVKLSNFDCAVKIRKPLDKTNSSDIFLFGKVISDMLGLKYCDIHTEDDESFKQLMVSLFELCTSTHLEHRPTADYILNHLHKHKR